MKNRKEQRQLRHRRLRQRIKGTAARPRMAICVSNRNIFIQFIDDDAMTTLASASTIGAKSGVNRGVAKAIGQAAGFIGALVGAIIILGIAQLLRR